MKTKTTKVRIKPGTTVAQDHMVGKWPTTRSGDNIDTNMEFDAEWNGIYWDCRADGYGRKSWDGELGGYGNGSIFAFGKDGVEVLTENLSEQSYLIEVVI